MITYADKERAKYWPVSPELMAQYRDGTHTEKDIDGNLFWMQNGLVHRDSDKPARIDRDGSLWWENVLPHRDDDKPAWISKSGELGWFQNGQRHRLHGPARIYPDGRLEWWINGENITQEVNAWLAGEEWLGTPEQIFEFQLRFT